jgi:hypothetical protein
MLSVKLTSRSELPFYCFADGQPKAKRKAKRGPQNVSGFTDYLTQHTNMLAQGLSEVGAEEAIDGRGPSKRSK